MNTIDLKEEVAEGDPKRWPAFAAEHPKLAEVLDETCSSNPRCSRSRKTRSTSRR